MHSSQNKTGVTDVFPSLMRSCQDFLASNYSTYWPIYGLNNNWMDFTIDRLNRYATTPPQVIRTIPISHQLHLARQNQTDVFPLLMRSRGYALCYDFQCIHGLIARRWNVALSSGTSSYRKTLKSQHLRKYFSANTQPDPKQNPLKNRSTS